MSRASCFIDNIEFWEAALGKFERYVGYRQYQLAESAIPAMEESGFRRR